MNTSRVVSWHLNPPRGAHPKSVTRVQIAPPCPPHCTLHLLHTLPPELFADPYELDLYSAAYVHNLSGARTDLEAPVFALPPAEQAPRALRIDVNLEDACAAPDATLTAEIEVPLHVRYGRPSADGRALRVDVQPPAVFWACARPRGVSALRARAGAGLNTTRV
jgi:hypothetical protein